MSSAPAEKKRVHSTARVGAQTVRDKAGRLIQARFDVTRFSDSKPRYIEWCESELERQQRIGGG